MEQQINLEKMTVEQLKALAYDQMVQAQIFQQNVQVLQAEIAKREQEAAPKNKTGA